MEQDMELSFPGSMQFMSLSLDMHFMKDAYSKIGTMDPLLISICTRRSLLTMMLDLLLSLMSTILCII
jgi:hypothetical protein